VLIALLASTIPVSILGLKFAMRIFPFWTPEQFSQYRFLSSFVFLPRFSFAKTDHTSIPTHRCMSVVAHSSYSGYDVRERSRGGFSLAELYSEGARVSRSSSRRHYAKRFNNSTDCCSENRDKTETLLAFGASRFEACRPLAVEALRLALMPIINQMR
jgi:hypothetical protein